MRSLAARQFLSLDDLLAAFALVAAQLPHLKLLPPAPLPHHSIVQ